MQINIKRSIVIYLFLIIICFILTKYLSDNALSPFKIKLFAVNMLIVLGSFFYCIRRFYWLAFGVISVFVLSVLFLEFPDPDVAPRNIINSISFVICVTSLVVMLPNVILNKYWRVIIAISTWGCTLFGAALFWIYYFSEKTWLGHDAILAIMQTNSGEAGSYIQTHINGYILLLLLILFIAFFILCRAVYYDGGIVLRNKLSLVMLCIFIILNLLVVGDTYNKNYYLEPFWDAYKILKEYKQFRASSDMRNVMINKSEILSDDKDGLYVLVIGESQTRAHMSAYGYDRQTTPWLNTISQDENTLVFTNAFSCHTHTVPVLSYALTERNQYNDVDATQAASLVEMVKAAGYKVVWLSNQAQYGVYETPTSVIADAADEKIFISDRVGSSRYYDGALINVLNDINMTGKTLLIVHLMGCHVDYVDRYPSEMSVFSEDNNVDVYDNAVFYNDVVMKKLYENIRSHSNFRAMVYFSDHGEDVEDNLGHNSGNFKPVMAKIPLYMIFSPTYVQKNGQIYRQLLKAKENMFTNDLIYNALLGVMGIHYRVNYEPWNDLTSSDYDNNEERFLTLYGKVMIKDIK